MNTIKIITLIENELGEREDLYIEHGLSIYIEAGNKNILFDTGKTGDFIDNAKKLKIDLENLDYVIISHGHYDHSGGLKRLVKEIKPDIKLYVGSGFFNKKYALRQSGEYEFIGNSFDDVFLKNNNIPTEYVDKDMIKITEDIFIFTNFNRIEKFENTNETLYLKEEDKYKKDMFLDEISLGIRTDKGLVVILGCSHVGIMNILDTIIERTNTNIHTVIGGTHLVNEDDKKINEVIDYLKEKDIKVVGACHCTGSQGKAMLRQELKEKFIENNTGAYI